MELAQRAAASADVFDRERAQRHVEGVVVDPIEWFVEVVRLESRLGYP
jgi:hypothetical protein